MDHASPISSQVSPQPALATRLRGLSRGVRGMVLLGVAVLLFLLGFMALAPLPTVACWLQGDGHHLMALLHGDFTPAVRWRLVAVTALPVALALATLWQLWCLFGLYGRGEVFGAPAAGRLRRFSWMALVVAVAQPISDVLMSVAISLDNAQGDRQLQISLSTNDYALLLLALVFVALARVMSEATRLAEENEQFV
jgi:hypothetical protein